MRPSPEFTHHFLSGLAWDAEQTGRSLVELLEIASRGQLVDTGEGKTFVGMAPDGTPVALRLPPRGHLRGRDVARLAGKLLDRARVVLAENSTATAGAIAVTLAPKPARRRAA